ncbi:hypothetical protein SVAN01_02282 [Stagonosporopsis vannaccii]|nr:hypothetical protein SVAN01_02282 [Stagonosporopsis vannaccii]
MGAMKVAMTVLRSLALLCTVVSFALGVWALVIIRVIDNRGGIVLSAFISSLGANAMIWSQYINAAARSSAWIWVIIVTSSIMTLTILLVILSNRCYWLRIPSTIVTLIELTSTILSTTAFGCALSLALGLKAFTTPPLATLDSADLTFFALLSPLSKALTTASTLVGFLLLTTFTASLMDLHNRHTQAKDSRAFEPTVSALGMSHGFHTLHPQPRTGRERIPTMYDPYRAFRKGPGAVHETKHVAFADEGVWMSRKQNSSRWSASTSSPRAVERDIMRLLEVKKARRAVPIRPARPVSSMWDAREIVHAI